MLYGSWWDRHMSYPSHDVADLDTLDEQTKQNIMKELDEGSDF